MKELTLNDVRALLQNATLGADGGWRTDYGYPDQWVGYLFSLDDHHQGSIAQKGFHATEADRALIASGPDLARLALKQGAEIACLRAAINRIAWRMEKRAEEHRRGDEGERAACWKCAADIVSEELALSDSRK